MTQADLPPKVYEFLAWLSRRDFVIRHEIPSEFEAPLAVARDANPPLVRLFDLPVAEQVQLAEDLTVDVPRGFGLQLTRAGGAALALHDLRQPPNSSLDAEVRAVDNSKWRKQIDVAKRLGKEPMEISRLCEAGDLRTNGLKGKAKRIDPASILAYCERAGIPYNET